MFLAICMSGKNAVGDSYKNIINEFSDKKEWICVVPEGYSKAEFDKNFFKIILDEVSHAKNRIYQGIKFIYQIRKLIIEHKVRTIFIYFDNHWINSLLRLAVVDLEVKFVVWVHDDKLHIGANRKDIFIRTVNSHILFKLSNKIILSYESARSSFVQKYNINLEKIKTIFLPRMLEMEFPTIKTEDVQILYDFVFFGRIEEYKGIELFAQAANDIPNKKFLILGTGNYENIIREKLKMNNNVVFINKFVDNKDLAMYIKQSRWVVLPYKEATGSQTVQIANYYERPVIATSTGCFNEYIKNKINGLLAGKYNLANLEKALIKSENIIIDKEKMNTFLEENFSIGTVVKKIENLL